MLSVSLILAAQLMLAESVWKLPDPTRPYNAPARTGSQKTQTVLKLQSIIHSRPATAIINGKAFSQGSNLGPYVLSAILNDSVLLKNRHGGGEQRLYLQRETYKHAVKKP